MADASLDALVERTRALTADGSRRIVGFTGPPGAGKSTLAAALAQRTAPDSIVVPMDGFHLANCELARLGRSARKGAEDTFDSAGYIALLRRLRARPESEIIYAPEFRREIEEAVAGAIAVLPHHRLIITEGNYLLLQSGGWGALRALIDEIWYVEVDHDLRLQRLIARHVAFGRDESAARAWVAHTDEPNAALIATTRPRADVVFHLGDGSVSPCD